MHIAAKIAPCLWFNGQAEEAANFYTSVFPHSKITKINRYPAAGGEVHGHSAGSVMTVAFELAGQSFIALNGGPEFQFSEAISFQVSCESQDEIDLFWSRLSAGGREVQCGWLKDQFGLSWQVVPANLPELFADATSEMTGRVMQAMLQMKKLDMAALQKARDGGS